MEEKKVPEQEKPLETETPLTRAELENQLNALAQRLSKQLADGEQREKNRQEALDSRESELKKREMTAMARSCLEASGMPVGMADVLCFNSEEAVQQGVSLLEKAFREAVQQQVESRLVKTAPKAVPAKPDEELSDDEYYALMTQYR